MMRPHPSSTLFPYTTLFRSAHALAEGDRPPNTRRARRARAYTIDGADKRRRRVDDDVLVRPEGARDRKSTRLNSSHTVISYAVFCLKKKKITISSSSIKVG